MRVACVGTVTANKGQAMLLRALQESRIDCELHLFGDASDDPAAVSSLRAAAGDFPVHFHGVLEPAQVAAQLHSVDLLVSASRHESFGMAVAEGAACGVPVLAFAVGEIASFVVHGRNGWLLPPTASDGEFALELQSLLRAPQRLHAARACAQRPSIGNWDDAATAFVDACAAVARS
jgi:glycosyltransferase involved in cell wall biosynthesis